MSRGRARLAVALFGAATAILSSTCSSQRDGPSLSPVYRDDVATILDARCAACHSGPSPAGGWSSKGFFGAIGCTAANEPAVLPADARAPIARALGNATHASVGTADERARVVAWVSAGAPAFRGTVHAASFVDPRSDARHGAFLRARGWAPMLDGTRDDACGRCHEGAPARPAGVTRSAPGATSCTSCHAGPKGPLECGTCHATGGTPAFPHTTCFFPTDLGRGGAHAAHTSPSASRDTGIPCSTCHPTPGADVIGGSHATGAVEVVFDVAAIGGEASYDRTTGACAVSCHNRGGARPKPVWTDKTPMKCGDCHTAPPQAHYVGKCSSCHANTDATGTTIAGSLHVNGKADFGDGSGACGACHGRGTDPWPSTGAHPRHAGPQSTTPVDCSDCHVVPQAIFAGGGHMDGIATVTFAGRAKSRGAVPLWDGTSCKDAACHGGALLNTPPVAPSWKGGSPGGKCGDCHGTPPPFQHTTSTQCERSECHGGEVERGVNLEPLISLTGRKLHIDGTLQP